MHYLSEWTPIFMLIFGQLSLMFITEKTRDSKKSFKLKVRIIVKKFVKKLLIF